MLASYTTVPKRFAQQLERETTELKEVLRMTLQYLPRRDEAPGFRARIDAALDFPNIGIDKTDTTGKPANP